MNNSISIRPSKDIRTNYAQISALTRTNPVAITVNGRKIPFFSATRITLISKNTSPSLKPSLRFTLTLPRLWTT